MVLPPTWYTPDIAVVVYCPCYSLGLKSDNAHSPHKFLKAELVCLPYLTRKIKEMLEDVRNIQKNVCESN